MEPKYLLNGGTAYLAPEPGGKICRNRKNKKGDTILIVEAMKTMDHVSYPVDGVIKKFWRWSTSKFGQTIAILISNI